ncbi:class I SAM-dependent methyltransferase [Leptolyngbya sp. Cla-17]|uniref:class I SAM-dependent methyltransferase n=1 Tax=Leptolyngbya sp. Cla-17 TaxID=2803751 RepID=UPI0018DA008D|nr:methyltransferase domain-containing protein [Leptolyngbya sp. Cla-17]
MPVKMEDDMYKRSVEIIEETYLLEKELGTRLKNSTKAERQQLYISLYDNLFQKLTFNPILHEKTDPEVGAWVVARRMELVEPFLTPGTVFLEIGAGSCGVSLEVAKHVKRVYAIDVSFEVGQQLNPPANFEFIVSDGLTIPVPNNSISLAFSHQLMEHLHPEDAVEQLQNVYKAISPGGSYICVTPNRLSGPHDASQFFDDVATGWHLKEYSLSELYDLFRQVGFTKISYYKYGKGANINFPLNSITITAIRTLETLIDQLPVSLKRKTAKALLFRGITMIGVK